MIDRQSMEDVYAQGVSQGVDSFLLYLLNDNETSVVGIRTEDPDAEAGWSYRYIQTSELEDWAEWAKRDLLGS